MRLALLANSRSGRGSASSAEDLLRATGAEVLPLGPDGELPRGGCDRLVVASGDGGVGPAAVVAAQARVPLAVVPVGTANDFARSLGLPLDVGEAARLAADADARTQPHELARLGERPFVNVATAGLSVLAARAAAPHKRRLGPLAYALGAGRAALSGRPLRVRALVDGEEAFDGRAWQVAIACSGAFGGGAGTGAADPDDGRLDLVVVPEGPRLTLARHAAAMRAGRLAEDPSTRHVAGRRVELHGPRDLNVDGELCRTNGSVTATVTPRAFSVVVPPR